MPPRIVPKTSRYPIPENQGQSTRESLVRPSTMKQATMTMTLTAMPLLAIIPPPFCVRHLHGPVTGSDLGLAAGGKEPPTVCPPDRQPRPQWAARGSVLTATRSAHIIRQFPDEEAEPSYQKPNWPAGCCRRPLPLPRRATAAPGAGRLLSAPARARIVTRLAGPRVGAFWKPGDPALISLPGPAWLDPR